MTLREHIDAYRIYLSDSTGRPSDEITYPNRLIGYELITAINSIIPKVERRFMIQVAQTVCLTMKEVDIVECPCAPAKGCTYMKSVEKIPSLIGLPIDVSTADSSITYTYLEWTKFKHMTVSRIKAEREGAYYTVKNINDETHLYVYHRENTTNLKTVQFTAFPLDPIKLLAANCGGSNVNCNPMDVQITIPELYMYDVFGLVSKKLGVVLQLQGGKGDVINNDNPDHKVPLNSK